MPQLLNLQNLIVFAKEAADYNLTASFVLHTYKWKYIFKHEYDLSLTNFNRSIEINPKHANFYNDRGDLYFIKGQFDLALDDCNKAIELNPKLATAYFTKGKIYDNEAIETYRSYIITAPDTLDNVQKAKNEILELGSTI